MADNEPKDPKDEPDLDSLYGTDLPSYEQVAGEAERARPVGEPPAPPVGRPVPLAETSPPPVPAHSPLLEALGPKNINEILPQLSEEERKLLYLRFDLSTGERLMSQRRAADALGIDRKKYRAMEQELMEQINNLANLAPPPPETE